MLRRQARARDGNPACRAQHDGFCARLYQAHDIGVQADGGHGHHDEELAAGAVVFSTLSSILTLPLYALLLTMVLG